MKILSEVSKDALAELFDPEEELNAFCDAFREGRPFDKQRLFKVLQWMGYGLRKNDPKHDQYAPCARPGCGHPYYRHFDPYEGDREVGCKYCSHYECRSFVEPAEGQEVKPAEPGGLYVHLAPEPREPRKAVQETQIGNVTLVSPMGDCDGSGLYSYDEENEEDGRGAKLQVNGTSELLAGVQKG